MNYKKCCFLYAIPLLLFTSNCNAYNSDWYIGGDVGVGYTDIDSLDSYSNSDLVSLSTNFFGGYIISDSLSIELGLNYFSNNKAIDESNFAINPLFSYSYNVSDSNALYINAGVDLLIDGYTISPMAGIGIKHQMDRNWSIDIGYRWHNDAYGNNSELYQFIFGLRYDFFRENKRLLIGDDFVSNGKNQLIKQKLLIPFDFDSFHVKDTTPLIELAHKIKAHPHKVNIIGYTDGSGDSEYNNHLAYLRATDVKNLLVSEDIDSNNIRITSMGENNDFEQSFLNRRALVSVYTIK